MHSAALGRPNNSEWVSSLSRKADTMTRLNKSYVCLVILLRFCPLDLSEYSFLMHFLFSVLLVRDSPNMAVSEQGRLHGDEELQSPSDISRRSRSHGLMNTQHPAMPRWSWVERNPGCRFMSAASSAQCFRKKSTSLRLTLNLLWATPVGQDRTALLGRRTRGGDESNAAHWPSAHGESQRIRGGCATVPSRTSNIRRRNSPPRVEWRKI
jgi:hypothetical protein